MTLDTFGTHQESILSYLAERCKGLQELTVPAGFISTSLLKATRHASNLKTLVVSSQCQITIDTVTQILGSCSNLERVEFWNVASSGLRSDWKGDMSKLRSLVLNACSAKQRPRREFLYFAPLLQKMSNVFNLSFQNWLPPNLHSEPVTDFSTLSELRSLDFSNVAAMLPPRLPPSLRTLNIAGCLCGTSAQSANLAHNELPQLVRLSVAHWSGLSCADLQALLETNKGKITHLDISGCIEIERDQLKELVQLGYLEEVEELKLNRCCVDDMVAIKLARKLSTLKVLEVGGTKITGVGVKALVTGLQGKLKYLRLDDCSSTSIDAVEFANSMGVVVSFKFPDAKHGKKIRQAA